MGKDQAYTLGHLFVPHIGGVEQIPPSPSHLGLNHSPLLEIQSHGILSTSVNFNRAEPWEQSGNGLPLASFSFLVYPSSSQNLWRLQLGGNSNLKKHLCARTEFQTSEVQTSELSEASKRLQNCLQQSGSNSAGLLTGSPLK